jgi:hypothetical protein
MCDLYTWVSKPSTAEYEPNIIVPYKPTEQDIKATDWVLYEYK